MKQTIIFWETNNIAITKPVRQHTLKIKYKLSRNYLNLNKQIPLQHEWEVEFCNH